jgi:lysophospholipase L1-like esterase
MNPYISSVMGGLICVALLVSCANTTLKNGERIVFFGDSITEQGDLSGGYVRRISEEIGRRLPDKDITVIGAGISGNKVPDLEARLDRDVLSANPTMVVVYIGINDVWHSTYAQGTPKDDYESGLRNLIRRIQATGAKVILCTPSMIGEKTDGANPLDSMLDEYAAISRSVAKETKASLIDLRRLFLEHLRRANPDNKDSGILTQDGVHLNADGNRMVARWILDALGMKEKQQSIPLDSKS